MALSIPNTFTAQTTILSSEVNENFTSVADQAVAKAGDTMTGNLSAPGVTCTGTTTSASVVITATGASALDVGGGINAGTGNVGIVDATGKIPAITSTYFASLDGSALTGIASGENDQTVIGIQVFS